VKGRKLWGLLRYGVEENTRIKWIILGIFLIL
jgi:hypothetical protein